MGYVQICDLCKRPLYSEAYGRYKIKKEYTSWYERNWIVLECHDECVRKLLEANAKLVEEDKNDKT